MASQAPDNAALGFVIAAAIWDDPQRDPLETTVELLENPSMKSGWFPLEPSDLKKAAEVLPTLKQALELKRSSSKAGIQEQGNRVVVGGTFIRKRNT